jgi:hypothetical protein
VGDAETVAGLIWDLPGEERALVIDHPAPVVSVAWSAASPADGD